MPIGRWEVATMSYVKEAAYGTDPGSGYNPLWHNSHTLHPVRETLQANRKLGDRSRPHPRLGLHTAEGDIVSELCLTNLNWALKAAMGSSLGFETPFTPITGTTFSAAAVDQSFNDSGTNMSPIDTNDWIRVTGFTSANNNGDFKVTTGTANNKIIVAYGTTLTDESAGDTVTFTQIVRLVEGTTEDSFTIWQSLPSLTTPEYFTYTGAVIDRMSIDLVPDQVVKATFGIKAQDFARGTVLGGAATALTNYEALDCLSGTCKIGGSATTKMTSCRIDVTNNYKQTKAMGTTTSEEAIPGEFNVEGSVSLYYADGTELAKFLAETLTSIDIQSKDPDGGIMWFRLPSVKLLSAEIPENDDGPVVVTHKFHAARHANGGTLFIDQN